MINFIMSCNHSSAVKLKTTIDSHMMNYDLEVKYHFLNKDFKEKVKTIYGNKVYIFENDCENNGLEAARYIREILDDWNSLIILVAGHREARHEVLEKRLFLFDVIINTFDFLKIFKEDLEKIMKIYNNRHGCLTFESNRVIKRIDFNNIDMIVKEKDSKKCMIKASYGNYYTVEPLNKVSERLDKRFVKINRSCIINADQIEEYNTVENKITLKNGFISYDISRDYKKKVSNYVCNYK